LHFIVGTRLAPTSLHAEHLFQTSAYLTIE
jgi:hypothetical protein